MAQSQMGPPGNAAQNWQIQWAAGGATTWTFSPAAAYTDPGIRSIAGGNGGLFTSVHDLSRFMSMWLSHSAPLDPTTQTPILQSSTLANALVGQSTPSPGQPPPTSCAPPGNPPPPGYTGPDNAFYSACGSAPGPTGGFGVNWFVGNLPPGCQAGAGCNYIEHNGSTGLWGSQTRLSISQKMAATGLISTDPYPNAQAEAGLPQPPGLSTSFMNDVVYGTLSTGMAADAATTTWTGSADGTAVARALFLTGAPTSAPSTLAAQFTPAFLASQGLTTDAAVASFVATWFQGHGSCSTFRVRDASLGRLTLRLKCQTATYDMTVGAETTAPYRIGAFQPLGTSSDPY